MNHLFFLCGEKCRRTSYTFLSAAFLLKCVFVFGSFLCRRLVETFIDRIEVFNDERVKIRFTFEDVLAGYAE